MRGERSPSARCVRAVSIDLLVWSAWDGACTSGAHRAKAALAVLIIVAVAVDRRRAAEMRVEDPGACGKEAYARQIN